PTILSRCQIYDFNRIRVEDSVGYLKHIASSEGIAADEESLNLIAQKADGCMRDALSMFDKAVSFCGTTLDYRHVAQTLNVLDYDTYFGVTEMLLSGDYVQALVAFDGVLSQGFSGQTFMAGLNRHMRDLLMAKKPETLRLIEMTGTLLERYRTQAGACEVGFLFGAIACLTELDGKIRQSSNQRLLVELGLMKIAGLGKKKNDTLTSPEEYPLPELKPRAAAPAPASAGSAPAAAPALSAATAPASAAPAASVSAPAPQPAQAQESVSAIPAPETSEPISAPPKELAPQSDPAPALAASASVQPANSPVLELQASAPVPQAGNAAAQPTAAVPQPAPRSSRKPLISGASLSELLASPDSGAADTEKERPAEKAGKPDVDPRSTEKLENARERILNLIKSRRPRFVPAFERMQFRENVIAVSVPTEELREEILRNKTAMLIRIAELAGIGGVIDLDVTVNEAIRAARPIKPEDKVKFLTEKNPLVAELRKALDLEME
ncbi:MAG: DNA polymerase III subunit gamma/tau, partial [Alistipes sp.]|nr:DNA polymerase III subunit gamma/tau [Alistipes sp.]